MLAQGKPWNNLEQIPSALRSLKRNIYMEKGPVVPIKTLKSLVLLRKISRTDGQTNLMKV